MTHRLWLKVYETKTFENEFNKGLSGVFAGYDFELSCNDAVVEVFPLQSDDKILGEAHYADLLAQVSFLKIFCKWNFRKGFEGML